MIYPVFALVLYIFIFLYINFYFRVAAVRRGQVNVKFFRSFQRADTTEDVPEHIIHGRAHFANLFETPVLFFLVSVLAIVLQAETQFMVICAWLYVGARFLHSIIHALYNKILHRMLVFQFGVLMLLLMWLNLFFTLH